MSSAIAVIVRREYLARVTTKGFWLGTALFPVVIAIGGLLPSIIAGTRSGGGKPIVVLDRVGGFQPMVAASQRNLEMSKRLPLVGMSTSDIDDVAVVADLEHRMEAGHIEGFVVIDSRAVADEGAVVYFARNPSGGRTDERLEVVIQAAITRFRLARAGATERQMAAVSHRTRFEVRRARNDSRGQRASSAGVFVTFGLALGLYVSLTMYGTQILRGVLEEKANRIVEIIITAARPLDLMAGKILGIGAVGVTQMCIWSAGTLILTAPAIGGALSLPPEQTARLTPTAIVWLPVYFVLGYLLYATVFAAIGASFSSEEEAQQLVVVAQTIVALPMLFFLPVVTNPSGRLAVTLSLIPFLSPTLMYLRIVGGAAPWWQVFASIVLMLITTVVLVAVAAKIYRVGILMYGKKPTVPEIIRWLRYS